MSKKTFVQVRTNTNFSVNYEDSTLSPEIELILLFVEPKYELDKKGIVKGNQLNEFRIKTTTEGIATLIGELQALQTQLLPFTNMAEGLNAIIRQNTTIKK
jgi:hypothetical protein